MKRLLAIIILPLLLAATLVVTAPQAAVYAAQSTTTSDESGVRDPAIDNAAKCDRKGCNIIRSYVNPVIVLLSTLVGVAVAIGIMVGGIQVASSAGDPQKSASGKKHIQNAIIGLVGYAVLFAFLQFLIPGGVV